MARNDIITRGSLDLAVCIATKQHLALLNPVGKNWKVRVLLQSSMLWKKAKSDHKTHHLSFMKYMATFGEPLLKPTCPPLSCKFSKIVFQRKYHLYMVLILIFFYYFLTLNKSHFNTLFLTIFLLVMNYFIFILIFFPFILFYFIYLFIMIIISFPWL